MGGDESLVGGDDVLAGPDRGDDQLARRAQTAGDLDDDVDLRIVDQLERIVRHLDAGQID